MKNRLACIQCFVAQERYIPLEEYNHKIYLFVVYDTFFTVILKKKTHGQDLLAIRIPYRSTCNQMKTLYYEVVEPSNFSSTKDGILLWSCPPEEIPPYPPGLEDRLLTLRKEKFEAGPTKQWESKVISTNLHGRLVQSENFYG